MSTSSGGYFNQGLELARKGQWKEAADAYREAVRLDPGNADALLNLGFVYYELGLDQEAQETIKAAQSLRELSEKCDPSDP